LSRLCRRKMKEERREEKIDGNRLARCYRELPMNFYYYRFPDLKRVTWPPPPEEQDFDYVEQAPIQAKVRRWIITITCTFFFWRRRVANRPLRVLPLLRHCIVRHYTLLRCSDESTIGEINLQISCTSHAAYNEFVQLKQRYGENEEISMRRIDENRLADLRNRDALYFPRVSL